MPRTCWMHYVSRSSHQIQKHKFVVMCPIALFLGSAPGPPEHEKYCTDVSYPGCTQMHYVIRRLHLMQKLKCGELCPAAILM
jgi:hypothetical protein